MKNNLYITLGTIFLALSGLLYTAERVASRISSAIIDAGFASTGSSTSGYVNYPGLFENFFVWLFFLLGLLLLAAALFKKNG